MDIDAVLPPPGEEGFTTSHWGEEQALYSELEQLAHAHAKPADTRDRSLRIAHQVAAWTEQYEALTDALLAYLDDPMEQPQINDSDDVYVHDVHSFTNSYCALGRSIRQFKHESAFTNVTLLRYGCIRSSPVKPSVAITVRTLAVYRQTHRVCPRLSIHAEAKKLCHMHNIRYQRYLADQLCAAYNVYLELQRRVTHRLDKYLGRDTPDWRMLNSCTACQYTLEGEPPLLYSIICACDGNNSAKLVDPAVRSGVEHPDPHSGTSPRVFCGRFVQRKDWRAGRKSVAPCAPTIF
ncbi:hypothetical protein F4604DRAFT_1594845 [Suillus subluteus]|nr:hypothetical protein F4604DRAFT_1594845 [Suillus subluteus]